MKLNPDIFIEAAERIDDEENMYCCTAIKAVTSSIKAYACTSVLAEYFKPYDKSDDQSWFGAVYLINKRTQAHRIMSLLLMAEIVRDLNKKKKKK